MQIKSATSVDPIIVHDDIYENWAFSKDSPTQGRRFTNGLAQIQRAFPDIKILETRPATFDELGLVHSADYILEVIHKHECNEWTGKREDLALLAQLFAGGTIRAFYSLLEGQTLTAIHLPGAKHHAQYDRSSGFCVFADFAIAAKLATNLDLKVAIFDFDAHHGDGTENLTADNLDVLTFSVHEKNIFPFTGNADDPARHIYNEALPTGSGGSELADAVSRFIKVSGDFNPDIMFIAAGADGHESDPLAHLRYKTSDVHFAMSLVRKAFPKMPILMGGAGGYQPDDATPAMWLAAAQALGEGAKL